MLTNAQLCDYFKKLSDDLKLTHHFYKSLQQYRDMKHDHSIKEVSVVMEPFTWRPQGVDSDNPKRVVICAFTIWCALENKNNAEERSEGETILMAAADQIYAKVIQDADNWSFVNDFVRYTDKDSFEFDPVEFKDTSDDVGVKCEFELHTAPNFEIDDNVWN